MDSETESQTRSSDSGLDIEPEGYAIGGSPQSPNLEGYGLGGSPEPGGYALGGGPQGEVSPDLEGYGIGGAPQAGGDIQLDEVIQKPSHGS